KILRPLHRMAELEDLCFVRRADLLQHPAHDPRARHRVGVENKFVAHARSPFPARFASSAGCDKSVNDWAPPPSLELRCASKPTSSSISRTFSFGRSALRSIPAAP